MDAVVTYVNPFISTSHNTTTCYSSPLTCATNLAIAVSVPVANPLIYTHALTTTITNVAAVKLKD